MEGLVSCQDSGQESAVDGQPLQPGDRPEAYPNSAHFVQADGTPFGAQVQEQSYNVQSVWSIFQQNPDLWAQQLLQNGINPQTPLTFQSAAQPQQYAGSGSGLTAHAEHSAASWQQPAFSTINPTFNNGLGAQPLKSGQQQNSVNQVGKKGVSSVLQAKTPTAKDNDGDSGDENAAEDDKDFYTLPRLEVLLECRKKVWDQIAASAKKKTSAKDKAKWQKVWTACIKTDPAFQTKSVDQLKTAFKNRNKAYTVS
jgi:hypothetical protein